MKILIVCRWKVFYPNKFMPFVQEQGEAVRALGHEVEFFLAKGNYMKVWIELNAKIRDFQPDVIHAHFGICGFVAALQRKVPVVVTYPGSDINDKRIRPISILTMRLSRYNLFMSKRQIAKVQRYAKPEKSEVLRYGIMSDLFVEQDKSQARKVLGLDQNKKYVQFSGRFNRPGKDPELAKKVIEVVNSRKSRVDNREPIVELLQLTGGFSKEQMVNIMNAVDAALVTSKSEGSPQFTKEVMSCGTPIVSVDVGDVAEQVVGLEGCWVAKTRDAEELADLVEKAIDFGKTKGHQHILDLGWDVKQVAKRLIDIYEGVIYNGKD